MPVKAARGAKKKCDDLFSLLVRGRGICQRCGDRNRTKHQCAHIIGRTYAKTRTSLENAWCLCWTCHYVVDTFPDEKMLMIRKTIGESRYYELKHLANDTRVKMDWPAELERLREIERLAA